MSELNGVYAWKTDISSPRRNPKLPATGLPQHVLGRVTRCTLQTLVPNLVKKFAAAPPSSSNPQNQTSSTDCWCRFGNDGVHH
jgi:hypothetical protein